MRTKPARPWRPRAPGGRAFRTDLQLSLPRARLLPPSTATTEGLGGTVVKVPLDLKPWFFNLFTAATAPINPSFARGVEEYLWYAQSQVQNFFSDRRAGGWARGMGHCEDSQRESGKRHAEDSSEDESPTKCSRRKPKCPVHDPRHLACGSSVQCGSESLSTGRSADPYAGTSAKDKLASLRTGEAKGDGAEERAKMDEGNMWKGEQHGMHVLEGVHAGEVKDDGGESDEGQRDIQEVVKARERSQDERVPLEEKKENGLVEHKLVEPPRGLPKLDEIHAAERPKQLHVFLMQHSQAHQLPKPPASAWGAAVGGGPRSFASMLASSNTFASMLQTGLAPPANQQPFTIKLSGTNAFSAVLAAGTFSAVLAHGQDVKDKLLEKEDWLSDKKGMLRLNPSK